MRVIVNQARAFNEDMRSSHYLEVPSLNGLPVLIYARAFPDGAIPPQKSIGLAGNQQSRPK